jgi:hypothetical protein
MFGKSTLIAIAVLGGLLAPPTCRAQDAGVSGIPRGPGNVGGLNNSGNDPSGRGNAIAAPPPPSMAVPVVPSGSPVVSNRLSPRYAPVVRVKRGRALSKRDRRRLRAETRGGDKLDRKLDRTLSICRGC